MEHAALGPARHARATQHARNRVHGNARAAQPVVAVRPRASEKPAAAGSRRSLREPGAGEGARGARLRPPASGHCAGDAGDSLHAALDAGAFVVLLRAAGIPARVVTGYQGGEINPNGGYMIVRDSDAHAWAEALIDGVWQRYDPTAAVAPSRVERGLGAALPQGEPVPYLARLDMTWIKSLRLQWDAVNYQWQRGVVGFNIERQRDLLRDLGIDGARPWHVVALVAAIVFVWGLVILGFARARHARSDPAV